MSHMMRIVVDGAGLKGSITDAGAIHMDVELADASALRAAAVSVLGMEVQEEAVSLHLDGVPLRDEKASLAEMGLRNDVYPNGQAKVVVSMADAVAMTEVRSANEAKAKQKLEVARLSRATEDEQGKEASGGEEKADEEDDEVYVPPEAGDTAYDMNRNKVDLVSVEVRLCMRNGDLYGQADYSLKVHDGSNCKDFHLDVCGVKNVKAWRRRGEIVVNIDDDDCQAQPGRPETCCCRMGRDGMEDISVSITGEEDDVLIMPITEDTTAVRVEWMMPADSGIFACWRDASSELPAGQVGFVEHKGAPYMQFVSGDDITTNLMMPMLNHNDLPEHRWTIELCLPERWGAFCPCDSPLDDTNFSDCASCRRRMWTFHFNKRTHCDRIYVVMGRNLVRKRFLDVEGVDMEVVYIDEDGHRVTFPHDFRDMLRLCVRGVHRLFGKGHSFRTYSIVATPNTWWNEGQAMVAGCLMKRSLVETVTAKKPYSVRVLAHEMSHDWWGGRLSLHTYGRDSWLSESFATYCEVRIPQLGGNVPETRSLEQLALVGAVYQSDMVNSAIGTRGTKEEKDMAMSSGKYSTIAAKGYLLLYHLMVRMGGPLAFDAFLGAWAAKGEHARVSTEDFLHYAAAYCCHPGFNVENQASMSRGDLARLVSKHPGARAFIRKVGSLLGTMRAVPPCLDVAWAHHLTFPALLLEKQQQALGDDEPSPWGTLLRCPPPKRMRDAAGFKAGEEVVERQPAEYKRRLKECEAAVRGRIRAFVKQDVGFLARLQPHGWGKKVEATAKLWEETGGLAMVKGQVTRKSQDDAWMECKDVLKQLQTRSKGSHILDLEAAVDRWGVFLANLTDSPRSLLQNNLSREVKETRAVELFEMMTATLFRGQADGQVGLQPAMPDSLLYQQLCDFVVVKRVRGMYPLVYHMVATRVIVTPRFILSRLHARLDRADMLEWTLAWLLSHRVRHLQLGKKDHARYVKLFDNAEWCRKYRVVARFLQGRDLLAEAAQPNPPPLFLPDTDMDVTALFKSVPLPLPATWPRSATPASDVPIQPAKAAKRRHTASDASARLAKKPRTGAK